MPLPVRARVVLWIVHAAAFVVLAATCLQYMNRPLRGDETDFTWQAREGVRVHGVPAIRPADTTRQMSEAENRFGGFYGLWHPPLYIYLLALMSIAGPADGWFRVLGVICLGFSFAIIWRMSRAALGAATPRIVVALPISFALFSPIVSQGSLFIDIDNTVLAPLILLFLWQFTLPADRLQPRRLVWLTVLLTLMLCAKVTTFPMVWLACAMYAACGERPRRDLAAISIIGVAGVALFAGLYAAYCSTFGLPWDFMFDVGFGGRSDLLSTVKAVERVLLSARWNLVWTSPVIAVLLAVLAAERTAAYIRSRRVSPPDVWLILSVGMYVAYVCLGAMLGKYVVPAALMGAAAIGLRVARGWADWQLPKWTVLAAWPEALAIAAFILPVPFERVHLAGYLNVARDPRTWSVAVIVAMVLAAAWTWARRTPASRRGDRLSVAGLSAALSLAVITPIQTARVVFSPNDHGPLQADPERGMRDVVSLIKRDAPAGATIVSLKDVGYYAGRKFIILEFVMHRAPQSLAATTRRADVWAVVDSVLRPIVPPERLAELLILRTEDVGTYRVYVLAH